MFTTLVTVVHIFICAMLILIVLLQQGKGADVGATFGGGSNTLFGASGADNLLTRVTTITAFCFMITSVYLASHNKPSAVNQGNLFQNMPEQAPPEPPPLTGTAPITAAPATGAPAADANTAAQGTAPAVTIIPDAPQAPAPDAIAPVTAPPSVAPAVPAEQPAPAPQ